MQLPTMASAIHGNYITHLDVSLNETEEEYLQSQDYKIIYGDLNKGAGGKYIYIWYKKVDGAPPITRLQVTFNDNMAVGLINAGYTKINKDLNAGAGGDNIYLWYFSGCDKDYDTPIVDMDVTIDAVPDSQKFGSGWERLACDLNRKVGGSWLYAWVKREKQTYICDVTATDSYGSDADLLQAGYIRVDEDTTRGAGGAFVFIWYRQTTDPKRALKALQIRKLSSKITSQSVLTSTRGTTVTQCTCGLSKMDSNPLRPSPCLSTQRLWRCMRGLVQMLSKEISTQSVEAKLNTCVIISEDLRKPPW